MFVTSKLNNGFHEPDAARKAFDETLSKLGFDYVDLFLIHWPLPTLYNNDFISTWQTLEEFRRDGRARSIGVSNFQVAHLERLANETDTVPSVNQIEVHPYFVNDDVRAVLRRARHRRRRPGPPSPRARCSTTRSSRRSPRRRARRPPRWCCAGTSSAATSSSRSR